MWFELTHVRHTPITLWCGSNSRMSDIHRLLCDVVRTHACQTYTDYSVMWSELTHVRHTPITNANKNNNTYYLKKYLKKMRMITNTIYHEWTYLACLSDVRPSNGQTIKRSNKETLALFKQYKYKVQTCTREVTSMYAHSGS